ncbi:hypothetical protein M9H77_01972 [Catharanthus roseus]|uniref:Uncharacterized protein n=1 Tax=Catharanthus roseus TaxID=4058 RepID=A0ACC0C775_CATRO|nr:hypothetical protein M9H77_01972 [Catharanthus roseus]
MNPQHQLLLNADNPQCPALNTVLILEVVYPACSICSEELVAGPTHGRSHLTDHLKIYKRRKYGTDIRALVNTLPKIGVNFPTWAKGLPTIYQGIRDLYNLPLVPLKTCYSTSITAFRLINIIHLIPDCVSSSPVGLAGMGLNFISKCGDGDKMGRWGWGRGLVSLPPLPSLDGLEPLRQPVRLHCTRHDKEE